MYLRVSNRPKGQYLTICEKYRDKASGTAKDKTVQVIGYADDYRSQFSDPIEHFRQVAREMTEEKNNNSFQSVLINMNEEMNVTEDSLKNVGYCVLKRLYQEMELSKFWKSVISAARLFTDSLSSFKEKNIRKTEPVLRGLRRLLPG